MEIKNKKIAKPGVIWITGLSGSGKTTIAKIIYGKLKTKYSNIKYLDGDSIRKKFKIKKKNSFSYNSRKKIGLFYGKISKKYSNSGKLVLIAVMALIEDVHKSNKKNINNYKEIFLDVPTKELIKRDPKNIYKKFFQGKYFNVAGLDLKYDRPTKPYLLIKWKKSLTKNKIANIIIKRINFN